MDKIQIYLIPGFFGLVRLGHYIYSLHHEIRFPSILSHPPDPLGALYLDLRLGAGGQGRHKALGQGGYFRGKD